MGMFCYQCEQTVGGKGCTTMGVCGKHPDIAALLDVIIHQLKGIGFLAHQQQLAGTVDNAVNRFTLEALFSTVTNVDFDPDLLMTYIVKGESLRQKMLSALTPQQRASAPASVHFMPGKTAQECVNQAS